MHKTINYALVALPLAAGWLAGTTVKILRLWWAALVEGYETGSKL
jgi:hypothetical protein